jgi:hypothetical protein
MRASIPSETTGKENKLEKQPLDPSAGPTWPTVVGRNGTTLSPVV